MVKVLEEPVWLDEPTHDETRYPKLSGRIATDVAIIGGGIVGILTAFQLRQAGISCVLVDKQNLATESTGYTTALVSRSPDIIYREAIHRLGLSPIKQWLNQMRAAQVFLRKLATQHDIECEWRDCASYFYSETSDPLARAECEAIAATGHAHLLGPTQLHEASEHAGFKLGTAVRFDDEAHFHPRKFLLGLIGKAPLSIFENSEAIEIKLSKTGASARFEEGEIEAKQIVLAGRSKALPSVHQRFKKKKTYLVQLHFPAGAPFSDDLFWDNAIPYNYFRRINGKDVLLGGEDTSESSEEAKKEAWKKLQQFASAHWPEAHFELVREWQGTIFETDDYLPRIGPVPGQERVLAAQGFAGVGMVTGALASQMLAAYLQGERPALAEFFAFEG